MTTPHEQERVWRVVEAIPAINDLSAQYQNDIAEAILSERAELLAAAERMRGALMAAQSFIADGGLAETDPGASIYRQITDALTTGEANHKDKP